MLLYYLELRLGILYYWDYLEMHNLLYTLYSFFLAFLSFAHSFLSLC